MNALANRTTIVVGASRGLGRGIATALGDAGAPVVAVSRSQPGLAKLADTTPNISTEVADASDPTVAGALLDRYEPSILILVAGATPLMRPLQHQTWETFSVNWHTDVRIAFYWLRQSLLKPLGQGSQVVVISSGAAVNGSPLSGGYAGAKATSGSSPPTPRTRQTGPIWESPSPLCCPGSRRSPTSGGRPSRRTRLATGSPNRSICSRWANRSPQRSLAPPWWNWRERTSPPSPPPTF